MKGRRFARTDLEAIKGLPIQQTAERLGLIHQNVAKPRKDRWAFTWEGKHPAIEFFDADNTFHYHKADVGGSIVDLVILYLSAGEHDQSRAGEAMRWIAEREGLYEDWGQVRGRAEQLAAPIQPNGRSWEEQVVDAVENPRPGKHADSLREAGRLMKALGVPKGRCSVAMFCMPGGGEGSALCWIPACPWLGARVLRKDNGRFGGWTKERVRSSWSSGGGGRIYAFDFDGGEAGPPLIHHVLRLRRELGGRGLPVSALVFSSWKGDGVKVHFYFRAAKAVGERDYLTRHAFIGATIAEVVSSWDDVSPADKSRLTLDGCTEQITRLMRLPGFNKKGASHAGVLYETDAEAIVDLERLIEEQPVVVATPWRDDGTRSVWEFGAVVRAGTETKTPTGVERALKGLGEAMWPLAKTCAVEDESTGVLLRYVDHAGRRRKAVVRSSSWIDKTPARKAAQDLADTGAQIYPYQGISSVMVVGQWWRWAKDAPLVTSVFKPGWHRAADEAEGEWVYVAGEGKVYGADWQYAGPAMRGTSRGTLEEWKAGAKELAVTPISQLALGAAFAGALLEPLEMASFMLHISGDSSGGKSTCCYFGQSVWLPRKAELKWSGTVNRIEYEFVPRNSAVVVLDELKHMDAAQVGRMIHRFADGVGRLRLGRNSQPLDDQRWATCALSSGENALSQYLGEAMQGGQAVRALDIVAKADDCCTSDAHAKAIGRFVRRHYGVAGPAWAEFLAALDEAEWDKIHELHDEVVKMGARWSEGSNELGRILDQVALCVVALELACEMGMVELDALSPADLGLPPLPDGAERTRAGLLVEWTMRRLREGFGEALHPRARAYLRLQRLYTSSPGLFPDPKQYREVRGAATVVGVAELVKGTLTGAIFTTPKMLDDSGVMGAAGTSGSRFLEWAKAKKPTPYAADHCGGTTQRIGGVPGRWVRLDLAEGAGGVSLGEEEEDQSSQEEDYAPF